MLKIAKHPSLLYAEEIAAICAPLERLNINYFAHVRIDEKKRFSALSSNPAFTEHYLTNEYYTADIHMADEKKMGDFVIWDGLDFSGRSEQLCNEAGQFGIHNPFTIIKRSEKRIDYYHFANSFTENQTNQLYLSNLDLLNLFIEHFNEKTHQSKALSKAYNLTLDLGLAKQSSELENNNIICDRSEFMRSMKVNKSFSQLQIADQRLSKRQTEVLCLLVRGKTVKEISLLLGLSQRTVEHYFEAVKIKLNVFTRSELIAKTIDHVFFV